MHRSPPLVIACLAGAFALAACGGRDTPPDKGTELAAYVGNPNAGTSTASSSSDAQPGRPPVVATNVADPCTFFSKAEIELAFNVPFGPPKKGRDEPTCRFYNSNTGSVTIRAGEAVSRADFDSLRTMIGAEAEPVSGIGETAYFWGPRLYVRNAGRQLVINVSADQLTPQLRGALSTLGMLGASRLRP